MRYSIRSLLWLTALVALCCSAQPALPVIPVVYHCVVVFAGLFTFIAGANGRNRITAGIFGGAVGGMIGTILFLALMPPKHWLLGVGPAIVLFASFGSIAGACVGLMNCITNILFALTVKRRNEGGPDEG